MLTTTKEYTTTLVILPLLMGWFIADSRFDLAADLARVPNGEYRAEANSTTPDIPVNWFTATSNVLNQMPANNTSNKGDGETTTDGLEGIVGVGPANDLP